MRISDWRSDVCSSDLLTCAAQRHAEGFEQRFQVGPLQLERVEFGQAACGTEKLPIDLILEGVEVRAQHIADKARAHLGNTRAPAGRLLIMPDHEWRDAIDPANFLDLEFAGQQQLRVLARQRQRLHIKPALQQHRPRTLPGGCAVLFVDLAPQIRSEEHTSELQSLMRISYAVFCLNKKKNNHNTS